MVTENLRDEIYNTILLLGGKRDVTTIIELWEPGKNEEEILQELSHWNSKQIDEVKSRLVNYKGISIKKT